MEEARTATSRADHMSDFITRSEKEYIETELAGATADGVPLPMERYHEIIELLLPLVHVCGHARYDPNFGDDRKCACGHPYHRHFDSYEDMAPIGCKYCQCDKFIEAKSV